MTELRSTATSRILLPTKLRQSLVREGDPNLGYPTLVLADTFSYITIDLPGATQTLAAGINSSGQIVGGYILPDQSRHGFLDVGGVFTTVDNPNATSGSENTGINDSGQIVGAYDLNPPEAGHVFEGAHGFLDSGGTFTTIDDPTAGVTSTTAEKINNSGNIVGVYRTGGPGIGFLDVGGVFNDVNFPGALAPMLTESTIRGKLLASTRILQADPTMVFSLTGALLPPLISLVRPTRLPQSSIISATSLDFMT
jgi:hypothetical protein